jgi:hypothetical protein
MAHDVDKGSHAYMLTRFSFITFSRVPAFGLEVEVPCPAMLGNAGGVSGCAARSIAIAAMVSAFVAEQRLTVAMTLPLRIKPMFEGYQAHEAECAGQC